MNVVPHPVETHPTAPTAVDPMTVTADVETAPIDIPSAAGALAATAATAARVSIDEHRTAVLQRRDEAERLGEGIAELSARIQAATYELLVMIKAFDEREGWSGFKSCAHWLNWRTGLALGAAREKVRVARALADLPLLSDAMRRGRVSYSKVRALTRVATPDNERRLLDFALCAPAAYVERLARAWRRVDLQEEAADERRRHERRHLHTWVDDHGMVVVRGRLSPEVGAVVRRALEAAADRLRTDVSKEEAAETSFGQRQADAVGLVAESALAADLDQDTAGDRYQVVLHVEAESLQPRAMECTDIVATQRSSSEERGNRTPLAAPVLAHVSAETLPGEERAGYDAGQLPGSTEVPPETPPRPPAGMRPAGAGAGRDEISATRMAGYDAALEECGRTSRLRGNRPPDGVRCRSGRHVPRGGRRDPRRRAKDPHHSARAAAGPADARPRVPVPRLQCAALRRAPRPPLGRRRPDATRQPGPALPAAPSSRPRGGFLGPVGSVRRDHLPPARRSAVPPRSDRSPLDRATLGADRCSADGRRHRDRSGHGDPRLARRTSRSRLCDRRPVEAAYRRGC